MGIHIQVRRHFISRLLAVVFVSSDHTIRVGCKLDEMQKPYFYGDIEENHIQHCTLVAFQFAKFEMHHLVNVCICKQFCVFPRLKLWLKLRKLSWSCHGFIAQSCVNECHLCEPIPGIDYQYRYHLVVWFMQIVCSISYINRNRYLIPTT